MKPLPKFLIIAAIVGLPIFGFYYFKDTAFVKNILPSSKQSQTVNVDVGKTTAPSSAKVSTPTKKPISVCVVTWGGYAGAQYFNEGFSASTNSRYYKDYGIMVDFKVIEDRDPTLAAWKADECHVMWATADALPTEINGLMPFDPRVVMQADWSRRGDVAVGTREIRSVNNLKGKKVALLLKSPSNTLLLWMLEAAGMNYNDVVVVSAPSAPDAAKYFKANQVDAAVVWSPDDEDILANVPGSRVLASTGEASHIIPDIFLVKKSFIDNNRESVKVLIEGWLRGNAEINSNPAAKTKAVKILAAGLNQPEDFIAKAIANVRLVTYEDNVNFFNLRGGYQGVKGEDVYTKMSRVYNSVGLAPANVPSWRSVVDTSLLREIKLEGPEHAAEVVAFTKATEAEATAPAYATKSVSVKFPSGSYVLDENAKTVIDNAMATLAKGLGYSRLRAEGNTDDVGDLKMNMSLSARRAQAVVDYLVNQYGFDRNRFVVVGNGPNKPVADNATESGRAKNRRTDFEFLRNN